MGGRAAKPEVVAQLRALTGALTSSHGLSLAVKHRRWKKIVKRQDCQKKTLSLHLQGIPAGCWEALLPSPQVQTELQTLCPCWGCVMQLCPAGLQAMSFRSKNDVFDHHVGGKKTVRRTVSTRLMKCSPVEGSVHSFLQGTLAMPRMRHGISTSSRAEKHKPSTQTQPASLNTAKGSCTSQHSLLGSKS